MMCVCLPLFTSVEFAVDDLQQHAVVDPQRQANLLQVHRWSLVQFPDEFLVHDVGLTMG